jgi:hypothetical protein
MKRLALLGALALALPAAGQSPPPVAHHLDGSDPGAQAPDQEIESPMVVEVSLGATAKRKSIHDLDDLHSWVATETRSFVCRHARVSLILARKEEHHGKVTMTVQPQLKTSERRQDVDLAISMVVDGREFGRTFYKAFTIGDDNSTANKVGAYIPIAGAFGSASKTPPGEFIFTKQQFDAMFADGKAPTVRIVVTVGPVND